MATLSGPDANAVPAAPPFPAGNAPIASALGAARLGPVGFRFTYGEIPVDVVLTPQDEGHRLSLRALVGYLPYSFEDRGRRNALLPRLRNIARASDRSIRIDACQNIIVAGERHVPDGTSAVVVVSALVEMLLQLRPAFESLGDIIPDLRDALPPSEA